MDWPLYWKILLQVLIAVVLLGFVTAIAAEMLSKKDEDQ